MRNQFIHDVLTFLNFYRFCCTFVTLFSFLWRLAVGGWLAVCSPKWSVRGVRTKNIKFAHFDVFSHPHSKTSTPTSQFALYVKIWHTPFLAVNVHIGCGLINLSGAQNTMIFATKEVGVWYRETIVVVSVTSTLIYSPKTWQRKSDIMH